MFSRVRTVKETTTRLGLRLTQTTIRSGKRLTKTELVNITEPIEKSVESQRIKTSCGDYYRRN